MPNTSNQPLLSVCIPTYNRVGLLKICLDSIFSQLKEQNLTELVEVVVSDNASFDPTEAVALEYQKNFPQLKYFRNAKNLGSDLNVENSVLKASGKYCWYLGDDDVLAPGSLKVVTEILVKHAPAVLSVASATLIDPTKTTAVEFPLKETDLVVLQSFQEFMAKGYCLGILSTLLFDRELWLGVDRTSFTPVWLYYERVLKLMSKARGRKFIHIRRPCVFTDESCTWVKDGQELYAFLEWKNLLSALGKYGYDEAWVKQVLKKFPGYLILFLLRSKGHDLSMDVKHLKNIYKSFPRHRFYLFLATIIFYIPNFIIKAIRDSKQFLMGRIKI